MTGQRPAPLPPPKLEAIKEPDGPDLPVLELVREHDRGLVRYAHSGVDPAALVSQVALAWPNLKILVVASRVSHAREMRSRLEKALGRVALFTGQHHPARGSRVVVATYGMLGVGAVETEKRDVYITLDPEEIVSKAEQGLHEAPLEGIKCLRRARMYGLLTDDLSVSPWQRSWMTALFGLREVHVPRHGHRDLPVDVVFVGFHDKKPTQEKGLGLLREGVWRSHLRNRRVASLFKALLGKDEETLAAKFKNIAPHLKGRLGGRVGVLVEGVEHGLKLAQFLPGVPVVAGPEVWTEGLRPEQVKLLASGKQAKDATRAIVTSKGLERTPRLDVLLRADAGAGLPALPGSYLSVPNAEKARLLLIDLLDEHHPALRKRGRDRKDAYVAKGWAVLGRKAPSPMQRFWVERPEVGR